MKLLNAATAGTLESGDILIVLDKAPSGKGIEINLKSTVANQFGNRIIQVITETLNNIGIEGVTVDATDKGALDCTIKARVKAAANRAFGITQPSWD
jgi:citrate lyase subunit gamma (acyl carrier protein)